MSSQFVEPYASGRGYQDTIALAAPAAGAVPTVTVGGENYLRVLAAIISISTSAVVANRFVSLDYTDARGNVLVRNAASVLVTAGTVAQQFVWGINRAVAEWNTGTPVFVPLLDMFLNPGNTVKIAVDAIDVGDQLTSGFLVVERFSTGERDADKGFDVPASAQLVRLG